MSALQSAFRSHLETLRAPRTVATYLAIAAQFEANLAGRRRPPDRTDVEAFLARARPSGRRPAAATRNQELAALRVFARFACERAAWTADPTAGVPFAREAPRDPAVLSIPELQRFFRAAGEERHAMRRARALAILALLSQAGLRVHELVGIDVDQLDLASATLIAVRGKGDTIHDVPINAPALALLAQWLTARATVPGSHRSAALFVSGRGSRLSVRSVQRLMNELRMKVGTSKHITPHTLRHTTATLALTLGSDLSTVGDLLRHTDLNTTRRYLHLVDERRRDAVRRLAVSVPTDLVETSDGENAPTSQVRSACTPRSSQNVAANSNDVDAQYGLGDGVRQSTAAA